MIKTIQCKFHDADDAVIFVKILNKIKDEKMESLTSLDTSMLENAIEKGLESVEEIN
jgi:aromatic ring-opening dioxygenase LigB subunit